MQPFESRNTRIKRRPSSRISQNNTLEISQQDINRKIRELQTSMTTLRTNVQLRFIQISDPNIQLRSQIDRQTNNVKQLSIKINQLESFVSGIRESINNQKQIDNAVIAQIQNKLMIMQHKLRTSNQQQKVPMILPQFQIQSVSKQSTQIKVLKQIMNQQTKIRQKRDQFFKKQHDQLFEKVLQIQRQSYQHKDYQPFKSSQNTVQNSSLDINYLKDQIESISNKLSTDSIARQRKDQSTKQYIDSLINNLKQQLLNENKSIIQSQIETTKQINQSLQALYTTLSQNKQQLIKDLEQTQTLISENVRNLSKRIDQVRDNGSRPGSSDPISEPSNDLKNKIVHSIQMIQQRIIDIQTSKHSKSNESEKKTNLMFNQISTNIDDFQQSLNNWTRQVEAKNISIFKEISSNLKNMKLDLAKSKQQSIQRHEQLIKTTTTMKQEFTSLQSQTTKMQTHFKQQNTKLVTKIQHVRDFVDSGKMQLQKLINESLQSMELRNTKHNQYVNQKLNQMNLKFQQSIFEEVQKLTIKINKDISYLNEIIAQKDKRVNNEITIISEALRNNQIRMQGQVSQLQQKHIQSYLKLKTDLVQLQSYEAKLREKQSQRSEANLKNISDSMHKRIEFVTDGIKKAIQLNNVKDKTQILGLIEQNQGQIKKSIGNMKYQFTNDIYIRIEDERSQRQKDSSHLKSLLQLFKQQSQSKQHRLQNQISRIQKLNSSKQNKDAQSKSILDKITTNMNILEQQSLYLKDQLQKINQQIHSVIQENNNILSTQIQQSITKVNNQIYIDNTFAKSQFAQHEKSILQLTEIVSSMANQQ